MLLHHTKLCVKHHRDNRSMYVEVIHVKATFRLVMIAVILLGGSVSLYAQGFPLGLLPSPPAGEGSIEAYVWTDESVVSVGEPVTIHLRVSRPAFVYLFDLQPDGIVRLIFPNAFSQQNYLFLSSLDLPDGAYQLLATPPAGTEEFLVFATDVPLPLPIGTTSEPFPIYAPDAAGAVNQLVALFASFDETPNWGMGWHAIQIVGDETGESASTEALSLPAPPPLPPVSGQPATAWYDVDGTWYQGIPASGWYWYYDVFDRWHLCLVVD